MTSRRGFQPDRIDQPDLEARGWRTYSESEMVSLSPHYQSYIWACYLWAYQQTGIRLFLEWSKAGMGAMMKAGPQGWRWTSGVQLEQAKLLLPLAWLVRVEDTPEHRAWLEKVTRGLLKGQDPCGAICENLPPPGKAQMPPPKSNAEYGTAEASILQAERDTACDLLYTANFALLGLHEAVAATGDKFYREAEDNLAALLCRVQVRSEIRPELAGGWFRAFDCKR